MHEASKLNRSSTIPTGVGLGLRGAFAGKVATGAAEGRVAFFEVSPENYLEKGGRSLERLAQVAKRHPLLSHGLMLSLGGHDPFDQEHLSGLRDFCAKWKVPWHSDHLCFSTVDGACLHDLLPVAMTRANAKRIADRIRHAEDTLGLPIAIENISFYLPAGPPEMDEAEFTAEVCEHANCKLLLDVNNVFVNAKNFGFDAEEMLLRYPLERVVQLHVAGHEDWPEYEMLVDTHGATALPEVIELMQVVLKRCGPLPVLLERDNNIPPLEELLNEVARIQEAYDQALQK